MKATALADAIRLESENASDVATMKLLTRNCQVNLVSWGGGRNTTGEATESMTIGMGHRGNSESEKAAIAEELKLLERHLGDLDHLLAVIPPCPAHGAGCIAYAIDWVEKAKASMESQA